MFIYVLTEIIRSVTDKLLFVYNNITSRFSQPWVVYSWLIMTENIDCLFVEIGNQICHFLDSQKRQAFAIVLFIIFNVLCA